MKKVFFIYSVLLPLFVFMGCSNNNDEEEDFNLLEGTTWIYSTNKYVLGMEINLTYTLYFSDATYRMVITSDSFEETPDIIGDEEIGSYIVDYPHVYLEANKSSHTCLLSDDELIFYQENDSEIIFNKK